MDINEVVAQARDVMTVKRVFGDPYEVDGITVIPAAKVRGGAGGGTSDDDDKGSGTGFGVDAKPAGVFVVRDTKVVWQPAVDVNRVVATVASVVIVLVLARALVVRAGRRRDEPTVPGPPRGRWARRRRGACCG